MMDARDGVPKPMTMLEIKREFERRAHLLVGQRHERETIRRYCFLANKLDRFMPMLLELKFVSIVSD